MIVVATTLVRYAMADEDTWASWLRPEYEGDHHLFAAIELDAKGLEPFGPLHDRLDELGGRYWTYTLDDGRDRVTQANRQRHIAMGQNLAAEYAVDTGATHLFLVGADTEPPADALPRLLAVDVPVVGCDSPVYALTGPEVPGPYPLQSKLATGAVLIRRDVFTQLRWMADPDRGLSDDWNYQRQLRERGIEQVVRTDVVARHFPEAIEAVENRYPGRDMSVAR